MRLPGFRFTVRRLMVLVLFLALALHLGVTAWKVRYRSPGHVHTGVLNDAHYPGRICSGGRRQAFWPSFWRRSLGLSLGDLRTCGVGGGWLAEVCELDEPGIAVGEVDGSLSILPTPGQDDVYARLLREKGHADAVIDGKMSIGKEWVKHVR